jgi:hypothetical protein
LVVQGTEGTVFDWASNPTDNKINNCDFMFDFILLYGTEGLRSRGQQEGLERDRDFIDFAPGTDKAVQRLLTFLASNLGALRSCTKTSAESSDGRSGSAAASDQEITSLTKKRLGGLLTRPKIDFDWRTARGLAELHRRWERPFARRPIRLCTADEHHQKSIGGGLQVESDLRSALSRIWLIEIQYCLWQPNENLLAGILPLVPSRSCRDCRNMSIG